MDITTEVKAVILAALLVMLSACGDSNEVYKGSTTDTSSGAIANTGLADAGASAGNTGSTDGTPDTTAESQPTDANATGLATTVQPRFVTSACGSMPISTAEQSSNMLAPTAMVVGELVSSNIGAGSDTTNNEHYWSIALEPGHYHVVLDTKRVDGEFSNLGLKLSEIQDTGVIDLFTDSETDYLAPRGFAFRIIIVS